MWTSPESTAPGSTETSRSDSVLGGAEEGWS